CLVRYMRYAVPPFTVSISSLQLTARVAFFCFSLHDALPIFIGGIAGLVYVPENQGLVSLVLKPDAHVQNSRAIVGGAHMKTRDRDRKSTRLNSSHEWISYAVICLKKKKRGFVRTETSGDWRR